MNSGNLFDGIKVLAVARQIAAPFATYQLAMHGAEVLTIDNPKEVDSMRLVVNSFMSMRRYWSCSAVDLVVWEKGSWRGLGAPATGEMPALTGPVLLPDQPGGDLVRPQSGR